MLAVLACASTSVPEPSSSASLLPVSELSLVAEHRQAVCESEGAKNAAYPTCQANFKCKNVTADWPQCKPPADGVRLKFGTGNDLPIGGWWPPPTDGKPQDKGELLAYARANFSMVMVGDRDPRDCAKPEHHKQLWNTVLRQLDVVEAHGLQALVDGYTCSSWGGPQNLGTAQAFFNGEDTGPPGAWVDHAYLHKPSPKETKWIIDQLKDRKSVVGLLLADDVSDGEGSELEAMQVMRTHAPQLLPWVNQYEDPSDTIWLARGGFPYVMPELYSVTADGMPNSGASELLKDLENWGMSGERYGQKLWPLLNLPPGISKPRVRFQAYSALAYGAKGLFWFCWRNGGGWRHEGDQKGKTRAYGPLKLVNTAARAWAPHILSHPRFEGAYHKQSKWGFEGPNSTSHSPDASGIVTTMSRDMYVSVLSGPDSLLLFVVDKKLREASSSGFRKITLTLNPMLVGSMRLLGVDDGTGSLDNTWEGLKLQQWSNVDLQSSRLEGKIADGGAALLEIKGQPGSSDLNAAAAELRSWRHPSNTPNLRRVRLRQHERYNQRYAHRPGPNVDALIAAGDSSASVHELAEAGFNAVIREAKSEPAFRALLNDGLRDGLVVLARPDPLSSQTDLAAATRAVMTDHACHPSFGGVQLHGGSGAAPAADAVRKTASANLLALTTVSSLEERATMHSSNVPYVLLHLQKPFSEASLNQLSAAWQASSGDEEDRNALHVQVNGCDATLPAEGVQAASRFGAFAAVAFGAKAIVHQGIGSTNCTDVHVAKSIYANAITSWHHRGLTGGKPAQIFVSTPFSVQGTQRAAKAPDDIVQFMTSDLLVSVLEKNTSSGTGYSTGPTSMWHSRRSGVQTISKAPPPMLLVVDARSAGAERTATLELNRQVHSWVPMLGDVAAGFEACTQAEYGPTVQLDLKPGEGVLIMINMLANEKKYNSHSQMTLMASNETTSADSESDIPSGYERRPLRRRRRRGARAE